jgi:hypothetical protein
MLHLPHRSLQRAKGRRVMDVKQHCARAKVAAAREGAACDGQAGCSARELSARRARATITKIPMASASKLAQTLHKCPSTCERDSLLAMLA